MRVFRIERAGETPSLSIAEPEARPGGQPSVIHAGRSFVALLAGEFGDGTAGMHEVDHTREDIRAEIAASIRASVVDLAELDGALLDLYRQLTAPPPERVETDRHAAVKAEAQRRILALLPEWKQRNLTARAVTLAEKGRANWSPEELAEWEAGEALWDQVVAIRDASDAIEAMVPIPSDYTDDTHWPAQG